MFRYSISIFSFTFSLFAFFVLQTSLNASPNTSLFKSAVLKKQLYGITVEVNDISENGSVVPVKIIMFGFEKTDLYVNKLELFVCHMGFRPISTINFSRASSFYATRLKLKKSDSIFAKATLNNGEFIFAKKLTKVTNGGCGGGSSTLYPNDPILEASTPAIENNHKLRSWVKSSLPFNTSRLISNNNQQLVLKSLRVDVKIAGNRARVMLDQEFYNRFKRQTEGRFQLRLPETAVPYYVAFGDVVIMDKAPSDYLPNESISGFTKSELLYNRNQNVAKLKEAVMVPRKKAHDAYQSIVGQRRDPALVEWQGNGIFSINVFPIQTYSSHRVVIAYDMEIQKSEFGYKYKFIAPDRNIPIDIYLRINNDTAKNITFISEDPVTALRGDEHLFHFKPTKNNALKIHFSDPGTQLLHGSDKQTGDYFSLTSKLVIKNALEKPGNHTAIMALDTSATPRGNHFSDQVTMLLNILKANSDDIKQFSVLFFDVGTHWWRPNFIANTKSNRMALRKFIDKINLAGATDLDRALNELANPEWYSNSVIKDWDVFLFSDGFATWGDTRPTSLVNKLLKNNHIKHLYSYIAPYQNTDIELLKLLTAKTDGEIYHFKNTYQTNDAEYQLSLRAHRIRHWRIVSATATGADDIFLSNSGYNTYANQTLHFVGRGLPTGPLIVTLQKGSEKREVKTAIPNLVVETDLTPRIYAEAAIRKLEDSPDQHPKLTLSYASHFRIPRKTVSLLMLETEKDYKQFNINSNVKYSSYIKENKVAKIISKLKQPSKSGDTYSLPELPENQFEFMIQINNDFTICEIPSKFIPELDVDTLKKLATIKHRNLQLTNLSFTKFEIPHYSYMSYPYIRENIFKLSQNLNDNNKKQESLRMVSSIMEYDASIKTRLDISEKLLEYGFPNEAYFLITMAKDRIGNKRSYKLLMNSLDQQQKPQYAKSMMIMTDFASRFSKQTLEP